MVADDRGQLLLLGGLAMAIVFLAAIPLSNSLVVTESAATSDTVRKIDQTADREAAVVRSIRAIANRTDSSDEFNRTIQNYSVYRLRVSGQQSGVFVNATMNRSGSARETTASDFDNPGTGSSTDWELSNNSTRIHQFNATIDNLNPSTPPSNNIFTINITSEATGESWFVRLYSVNSSYFAVNTSRDGTTWQPAACGGTPPIELNISDGTCANLTSSDYEPLPSNYTDFDGPYAVRLANTDGGPDGSYSFVGTGQLADGGAAIAVPYVDVIFEGPDASYTRTISTEETE